MCCGLKQYLEATLEIMELGKNDGLHVPLRAGLSIAQLIPNNWSINYGELLLVCTGLTESSTFHPNVPYSKFR